MVVRTAIFDIQLWWISVEQIVLSHQIMLFEKKVEFYIEPVFVVYCIIGWVVFVQLPLLVAWVVIIFYL